MLLKWDARVDIANNGREAVQVLQHQIFDLILLDLQMPEMDGFEVAVFIRDLHSSVIDHAVPIIALTADAFPETRKKALATGMNDFITKPLDRNVLFQSIIRNLRKEVGKAGNLSAGQENLLKKANEQLFELHQLIEMVSDDTQVIKNVLEMVMATTPAEFERLRSAAGENNLPVIATLAHKFKSTFRSLGISRIADGLNHLQHLAENNAHQPEIEGLVRQITVDYEQACREINLELTRL